MERYGKQSSTKRTRHISIRYFYVTNKLQDKTLKAISHCPTKEMVSDYLSKSLQGSLFRTHRSAIMGINNQDEAKSFNAYKMQLAHKKPSGWMRSLFLFFILCFIFILNQYFSSTHITASSAVFRGVCWEIFIFHFILGDPKCVPIII